MSVLNGTSLKLSRGGSVITLQTECSVSFEREEIETTSKIDGGFKTVIAGKRSASVSFSGYLDTSGTPNYSEILADYTSGNATTFSMSNGASDATEITISGSCILTSFEVSAGVEDSVQVSGSFTASGTITVDSGV